MLSDFLFSLRIYGNPYASTRTYENLREVADASSRSLDKRYVSLTDTPAASNNLSLKKNGVTAYTIRKPDFNFQEFH